MVNTTILTAAALPPKTAAVNAFAATVPAYAATASTKGCCVFKLATRNSRWPPDLTKWLVFVIKLQ